MKSLAKQQNNVVKVLNITPFTTQMNLTCSETQAVNY